MPQDSHIPFYHTTIRRKLQEVFKIFLRKLCGVKFPSQCNSKCCCCGCLDNLRICLLADVRPAPAVPCGGDKKSKPPGRYSGGKVSRQPTGQAPAGFMFEKVCKCRRRLNAGDARGGAPCMKITLVTPFPAGEGGWGIGGKIKNQRQGRRATKKVSPRAGNNTGSKTAATP